MAYDANNVFAKILRGEIPCARVFENAFALAFHDIAPSAPQHILVIPKGAYRHYADFIARASAAEVQGFFAAVGEIAAQQSLGDFRLISNNGEGAGQSVPHFHVHLLAGKPMGALLGE
ncbi:MAG: HIT domain-containing protein [Pseudomonadota bacterium]